MKKKNYSVSLYWDKRYPKAGTKDLCPIQLGVNLRGVQFRVSLGLYATKQEHDKANSGKSGNDQVKELRKEMNEYLAKADMLLERMPTIGKDVFIKLFKSETDLFVNNKTDLYVLFQERVEEVLAEGRIKTSKTIKATMRSFMKYQPSVFLEEVDEKFLKGYRNWMIEQENSVTTTQVNLRYLRALYNAAIKSGIVSEKHYPFKNFPIGTSEKSKSVLYPNQLKALHEYVPQTLVEDRAKDLFFFSYFMNGANPKDIFYLRYKDIKGDMLSFVREKTKASTKVAGKSISVYLNDEMRRTIEKWGNRGREGYVFPVLNGLTTQLEREEHRMGFARNHNRALNAIGKKLDFNVRLNLNLARHSMATKLKIGGVQTSVISDMMGHTDVKTTAHYLKSLPDEMIKEISETLLRF